MAYMNQDKKAVIKAALDPIAKRYGIKYSLRVRDHMAITCTITAAPVDFIGNFTANTGDKFKINGAPLDHISVNPYWYQEHFTGKPREIIGQIVEAMKAAGYYDNSNAQIDYFDTAYYFDVNIGRYDKPFKLTKPTTRQAGALIFEDALRAKLLAQGVTADFIDNKMIIQAIG
jgi:hypothetical protein